jgi:hypothetical protein
VGCTFRYIDLQERFAAGLASHLSRSLPAQRGAAAPPAPQHHQQPLEPLPGSQSSLPTAGVSVYGDGMSVYMADDSVLDVSRGGNRDALNSRCTMAIVLHVHHPAASDGGAHCFIIKRYRACMAWAAQWTDLLTSIPEDPEMCRILEPLTMPPPAASSQQAPAQQEEPTAPSQPGTQRQPASQPTAQPGDVEETSRQPGGSAAVGPERDVSPQPNGAAHAASTAASAAEGRSGVQGSALDAQSRAAGTAHRQGQLAEPAAVSAQYGRAERGPNAGGTARKHASLLPQSTLSPTHLLQLVHKQQVHCVSLLADQRRKDEVPDASIGMSADAPVAAPAAPDDEVMMDEQGMDKFLLELHAN